MTWGMLKRLDKRNCPLNSSEKFLNDCTCFAIQIDE